MQDTYGLLVWRVQCRVRLVMGGFLSALFSESVHRSLRSPVTRELISSDVKH